MAEPTTGFLNQYPRLAALLRKLAGRQPFNRIRRQIKGSGNLVEIHPRAVLRDVTFDIEGNGNVIEIGPGCRLHGVTFRLRGDNHEIRLGSAVIFRRGGELWLEDHGGKLHIGEETTFEQAHLAVTEPGSNLTIGAGCMFAYGIDVRTGDSHSILASDTGERINYAEDVTIGDRVWVATHCQILKGVEIGPDSVVATGAVVTGKFPQGRMILAGNPAKTVREGITWQRARIYKD
jgi:acetyltransferase-like isoleucine patch superfamily enzyme